MSYFTECSLAINNTINANYGENKEASFNSISETNVRIQTTVPCFLNKQQHSIVENIGAFFDQVSVYYISDIHLDFRVTQQFPNGATDEIVVKYIYDMTEELFKGQLGNDIRHFKSPIILFGGDVAASFSITKLFYSDFIFIWENEVEKAYGVLAKEIGPLNEELSRVTNQLKEWKEAHPWINKARKPLDEYSDKKIPKHIKALYNQKRQLESCIEQKRAQLGLSYHWEEDYQKTRNHPYVYAVLGNHELWSFKSYADCDTAYKRLFKDLGIQYLNGRITWLGSSYLPVERLRNPDTGQVEYTLIDEEANPEYYNQQLFAYKNLIIAGDIGYAAMNNTFNASQGIYGKAIDKKEEQIRTENWQGIFRKAVGFAKKFHCSLVVLTHTPVADWSAVPTAYSNCVFFNGHTHRNIAFKEDNNSYVFADNQIGYTGNHLEFKKAIIYKPRNPFAEDQDGVREISYIEYQEFYNYVREKIPGVGTIERLEALHNGHLNMIKKEEYYGFFFVSEKGVYICNGGQLRKIGPNESLDNYYSVFTDVVNAYIKKLSPLRVFQEKLSEHIKAIGGTGRIHGTIVDIDFENHIMINLVDGQITYYNSPVFGIIKTYPNIRSLLNKHCPRLEKNYLQSNYHLSDSMLVEKQKLTEGGYKIVDIKNSPYAFSRKINALQRLFENHVLRDWNPNILL